MEDKSKTVEDFHGDLSQLLREFSLEFSHFPDGRIDYTNSSSAAVVDCFVRCEGKFLLLQRSDQVILLKESWSMITGFLDEPQKNLQEKAYEEIWEETGISRDNITNYIEGRSYKRPSGLGGKTWYVFPVMIDIDRMLTITLDWEHTCYAWANPEEIKTYDPTGRIEYVLNRILDK